MNRISVPPCSTNLRDLIRGRRLNRSHATENHGAIISQNFIAKFQIRDQLRPHITARLIRRARFRGRGQRQLQKRPRSGQRSSASLPLDNQNLQLRCHIDHAASNVIRLEPIVRRQARAEDMQPSLLDLAKRLHCRLLFGREMHRPAPTESGRPSAIARQDPCRCQTRCASARKSLLKFARTRCDTLLRPTIAWFHSLGSPTS